MISLAARAIMSTRSRPCVYRAPGSEGGVPARVILSEAAAELRSGRSQLIDYPAEGTVFATLGAARHGKLEVAGTVYVIQQLLRSPTPGLVDLGLNRTSGDQVTLDRAGAGAAAIRVLGRPVVVGGRTVRAQVSVMDVAEETDAGQVIEVTRTVLSLRTSDIVGIAAGAAATVDGEDYRIRVVLPDGRGLARVVLE